MKILQITPLVLFMVFGNALADSVTSLPSEDSFEDSLNATGETNSDNQCGTGGLDKTKIDGIQKKYATEIDQKKQAIQAQADQIKNDAPNPNGVSAALNIDLTFRNETAHIAFDSPIITMKDQDMSMDLPETTMKTQVWSWDMPTLVMKQTCLPGVPETVTGWGTCYGDLPFHGHYSFGCPKVQVRPGKPICTDTPTSEITRQEVKLDVPEITMKRQNWRIGVPEIRMVRQEITYNYPALIVKKITAETSDLEERARNLGQKSEGEFSEIQEAMKGEIQAEAVRQIDLAFSCQNKALSEKFRTAYNDLKVMQASAQTSFDSAVKNHASSEVIKNLNQSIQQLAAANANLLKQYMSARGEMNSKHRQVIEEILHPSQDDIMNKK